MNVLSCFERPRLFLTSLTFDLSPASRCACCALRLALTSPPCREIAGRHHRHSVSTYHRCRRHRGRVSLLAAVFHLFLPPQRRHTFSCAFSSTRLICLLNATIRSAVHIIRRRRHTLSCAQKIYGLLMGFIAIHQCVTTATHV